MCKTDKKTRNYIISLQRDKMSDKSRENWIWKKELTFDCRGQNETKYNRMSFLVLFGLTFEKTTENKSKELIKKSIWKQEIKLFICHAKTFDPYIYDRREMEVVHQKDENPSQLFRDQSYFNCVKIVPIYLFTHLFCSSWIRLQNIWKKRLKKINKPPCGHRKLNMQKSSMEVALRF